MSRISNNPNPNKGSFIRPSKPDCGSDKAENLVDVVNDILKKDPGGILPDSPLYVAALEQYNKGNRAKSTDRMPIPEGFCGIVVGDDLVIQPLKPVDPTAIDPVPVKVNTPLSQGPGYPEDKCLKFGEPGSLEYDLCGGEFIDHSKDPEGGLVRKVITPTHFLGVIEDWN